MANHEQIAKTAAALAFQARQEILKMTSKAKASHVGSALSVIDILSVLYSGAANISVGNHQDSDRDVVILSKGHAASAIYSTLALKGFFARAWLDEYCANGAPLGGHVTSKGVPGVELSTGSLGHGLPYGLGIALSRKKSRAEGRTFVVMSDGECDEGTTWESALLAHHHGLDNLTVIIDRNGIQSLKETELTLQLEPFAEKLMTSADNLFAAASKEMRVRVESSAKRLTIVLPRKVGSFFIGPSETRANSSAVLRI